MRLPISILAAGLLAACSSTQSAPTGPGSGPNALKRSPCMEQMAGTPRGFAAPIPAACRELLQPAGLPGWLFA